MKVIDILNQDKKSFSFEFFPPKNFLSSLALGTTIGELKALNPSFISVTYGAGGSTHQNTFGLVDYIQKKIGIPTMAHYTCVGATKETIQRDLEYLGDRGIENLMALRGDPPKGQNFFQVVPGGFSHSNELIAFVKSTTNFCIGCAGYPEKHVEAKSMEQDIYYLTEKVKAGADFVITQLFFENEYYFTYTEYLKKSGVTVPIIPGIMPITSYKQIRRIIELSNSHLPRAFEKKLMELMDDEESAYQVGVDYAVKQCRDLLDRGAPGIHFYTLNKSRATLDIFKQLGV